MVKPYEKIPSEFEEDFSLKHQAKSCDHFWIGMVGGVFLGAAITVVVCILAGLIQ